VTIQAQIVELLLELGQRTGTALLFITHNLGLVAESCARMLTMYAGQVVEDGPVEDILIRPLHPYTAGLLGSLPHAAQRKTRLPSIPGRVPSAHEMPPGCRFEPRCGFALPPCKQPQELERLANRRVRCWRHNELSLAGATA
jgi:peptide/nickel transport system ATP-binding protein